MPRPPSFLHLLLAAIASATALPGRGLLTRETTCSARGLQACPAGLPSNFCCPSGSTCMALAANTTALCCPPGSTCDKIQPITCDVGQQNPASFTDSPIKTTALDVPLASCGSGICCPSGYSCVGGMQCQRNADQSQPPRKATPTAASSSSQPPTPSPSQSQSHSSSPPFPSSTPSMTAKSSPSPSSSTMPGDPDEESHAADPKTVSIVAGMIGACTLLVLLLVTVLFCRRRRNRARATSPPPPNPMSQSSSPRPPRLKSRSGPGTISDPIVNGSSYRTDFILKPSPRPSSLGSNNSRRSSRRSMNNTPSTTPDNHRHRHRLSIPNPFDSPDDVSPSTSSARAGPAHNDGRDDDAIRGHVNVAPRLPPIRAMKVSSARVYPQSTSTCSLSRQTTGSDDGNIISVFADRDVVSYQRRLTHGTTFTDLMDEADLGDVHRGNPYVPRDGTR